VIKAQVIYIYIAATYLIYILDVPGQNPGKGLAILRFFVVFSQENAGRKP
jgi:hypothetical protein